jgi:hypothetical protein
MEFLDMEAEVEGKNDKNKRNCEICDKLISKKN